ncbi:MAG TPA: hypothetical protein VM366_14945 [Anaerolineae bacterium]|nr:hypothetical protein [Anaerolineae bacterium]
MAKVFGMHMIALKPGVKAEDFEKFVVEEVYPVYEALPYVDTYLLKGDRGDREGKYLAMFEFASVEARDQAFPSTGEMSEEMLKFVEALAALAEKWETFATPVDVISTDYVVVGK